MAGLRNPGSRDIDYGLGVFAITGEVKSGAVLLLDDIVDSAWTMTVVAALLKRAGAGPVWPVALATTSTGD